MFLHIGKNFAIPTKDIVFILDKKSCLYSNDTKNFIEIMKKQGYFCQTDTKDVKTYIITCKIRRNTKTGRIEKENVVYTSSISSTTLFKRSNHI